MTDEIIDPDVSALAIDAPSPRLPGDPWKLTLPVWARRRTTGVQRTLKALRNLTPWRELTPREQLLREQMRMRKELERTLRKEAKAYARLIVSTLTRLGVAYKYTKSERDAELGRYKFDQVKFTHVGITPEAFYYRVDTRRLPFGVSISQILDEDVIRNLTAVCAHKVRAHLDIERGLFLILYRAEGIRGIPSHVKFADMLKGMPKSASGLTVPVGIGENQAIHYADLGKIYSLLIGGTVGGGKSNYMHVIVNTLARRNPPTRVQMMIVDLKGGMDFSPYVDLPHVRILSEQGLPAFVEQREGVLDLLRWLHREGERRMAVIKEAGHRNIGRYNAYRHTSQMPHIVLLVDEWADVMFDREIRGEAEGLMANIASRFRAVGVHVILATQVTNKNVISLRIKGAIPAKLAFSLPSYAASMVVIDNGRAKGLAPAGRAIFQHAAEYEVQTPYINDAIIKETISGNYHDLPAGHDVTLEEVLDHALTHNDGRLTVRELWDTYKDRGMKQSEFRRMLKDAEGQTVVVNASVYRIEPGAGNRPRQLVAVEEPNAESETEGEQGAP